MAPDDVLRRVLAALSTRNWQETVAPWLESALIEEGRVRSDYVALRPFDVSSLRLSKPLVRGTQAKILVSTNSDSTPYLARLSLLADGQWRLRSFDYQCPACFGAGVLGDHPDWELCFSCGATGWGDVDF
jgi:ribosomal protein S27AE